MYDSIIFFIIIIIVIVRRSHSAHAQGWEKKKLPFAQELGVWHTLLGLDHVALADNARQGYFALLAERDLRNIESEKTGD